MAVAHGKPGSVKSQTRDVKVSREVAGVNVVISIVLATALLVVLNVISNAKSYRRDMETLGGYGLSDSAKKILAQIDQPVRLTAIYTSTKSDRKPEQYLPRLKDLLEEIHQYKGNVSVVNVNSDRQKADIVARLRTRLDDDAQEQRKLIGDFQALADRQLPQFDEMARQWADYPADGWLTQFGLAKSLETALTNARDAVQKQANRQRQSLAGSGLPDYPGMVGEAKDTLKSVGGMFDSIGKVVKQLSAIPDSVEKNGPALKANSKGVVDAAVGLSSSAASAPAPSDPGALLDNLTKAAEELAQAANAAQRSLAELAANPYVEGARAWRVGQQGALPELFEGLSEAADSSAQQMRAIRKNATADYQLRAIQGIREGLPQLVALARLADKAVNDLLAELGKVDEPTKKIFQEASGSDYLKAQLAPVGDLLKRADELPKLADQGELIEQISQDNIVLVELGDKSGVVSFDDVWPLATRPDDFMARGEDEQKRVFYGDMAISSKMLGLAAEPFAQVVLTYFERQVPWQLRQQMPSVEGPIPARALRTLRQRLEKANLKVVDWNMTERAEPPAPDEEPPEDPDAPSARPKPKPAGDKKPLQQVLLVLPPPEAPPMPGPEGQGAQWGPEHLARLSKLIDAGTPAIFLASYFRPTSYWQRTGPPYALGGYFRDQWGLEVRTDLRVAEFEPDTLAPGTYTLPVLRWTFMPLSNFTDNPIGLPLQARRFYWLDVCPIVKQGDGRADTSYSDVLSVSGGRGESWAVADPDKMIRRIFTSGGAGIRPDASAGDLMPPFSVAMEARRKGEGAAHIVVLGVGFSYIDSYLNAEVPRLTGEALGASEPPPTGDVDLVVNSVYHLAGKGQFIGAGPALVKPIKLIGPGTMRAVQLGFGLGWPVLMLALGGVVMLVRRRG